MPPSSLKDFYNITLKDPLFAAEGLNIDNAKQALNNLEKVTGKLEIIKPGLKGKIYFATHPLVKTLHPVDFLRCFLESETARRRFIRKPDFVSAKDLLSSYSKTRQALEKNLKAYKKACLNTQGKIKSDTSGYNFYCRSLTFRGFIDAIDLMITNTKTLDLEIQSRGELLLNSISTALGRHSKTHKESRFFSAKTSFSKIPQEKGKRSVTLKQKEIIKWAEEGRDFMFYLKKEFGNISTKLMGPIYYKLSQFDKKPTVRQFFVSIVRTSDGSFKYFSPILTDQFHFIELAKKKYKFYADIFTYKPLIDRGINYWYQPATSFYFTSDLSYYADLATIVDMKLRPKLNKSAVLNQKSSLLDLFLWDGYYHNLSYYHNILSRTNTGRKINAWHYLLIGRSYSSLYYLPFNKSVWRIKEQPNFLGNASGKPEFYLNLEQLPKSLTKKELKDVFYGGTIRAESHAEI